MPLTVNSIQFEFAVALGTVPGAIVGRVHGYLSTVAVTAKAIRATTYTPQGTDAQRSIASSSANDTAAGSGARKVEIVYLNTSFVQKTEVVTLNGTTGVNTVATDIAFIERMRVTEAGTQGGGNAGTISLYTQTNKGGSVWGSIAAEDNSTFWAHHYVPSGKTCYLVSLSVGSTVTAGQATLNRSGPPLTATEPQRSIGGTYVHAAMVPADHTFRVPEIVPGPDFVWLVERPIAVTASTVFGAFEYVEL